ncbi:OmpA family protein [Nonomuraea sp. NPDC052634]|uniref:OmpA family protein n=1 Tax=Nonomuraea sp. NPDC052634 TaxID=3155813 RepID=UPI00341BB851
MVLAVLSLCGCGADPRTPSSPPPTPAPPRAGASSPPASPSPSASGGPYVREGLVGFHGADKFRIEVKAVERHRDLTALKMEITNLEDKISSGDFGYDGLPLQTVTFGRFRLFDPVGKKVYFTLREDNGTSRAFGTRHSLKDLNRLPEYFQPGVRYPVEVYFPPLPAEVRQVSVVPDLAFAPFTGIPVTDGAEPPVAREREPEASPSPGATVQWQVVPPSGEIWSAVSDVNELIETPQKTTQREGTEETIGLRTDVLFSFDKADLSPKATAVLDEVVEETRERADPAKPPIVIEGHTDSKGEDAYNQKLSVRRAEAVRRYLAGKLGGEYRYEATGKGESEPIAENTKPDGSDNPEGRARNRRVEISYQLKQESPGTAGTSSPPAGKVRGSVREPAPFLADPQPVVGSLRRRLHQDVLRIDVHPFRRDGAYLLATFDVVSEGDRQYVAVPAPFSNGSNPFSMNADYARFTLVDPATKARYLPLKMDKEFVENFVAGLDKGEVNRSYVYYPAPADSVTSITLEVEGLGSVPDVPIE